MIIEDNKIVLRCEGFENRCGLNKRIALIRYDVESHEYYDQYRHTEVQTNYLKYTLYLDGKEEDRGTLGELKQISETPPSIVLLESIQTTDDDNSGNNVIGRRFDSNSKEDWVCLFNDIIATYNNRFDNEFAIAFLLLVFDRFFLKINIIEEALNSFADDIKARLVILINNAAFGLCPKKIQIIKRLIEGMGFDCPAFYPEVLEEAAIQCGFKYETLKPHSLTDLLLEKAPIDEIEEPSIFIQFIKWLRGSDIKLNIQDLNDCFPYLGEKQRSDVIRRYFLDVKKGHIEYNEQSLMIFSSSKYRYYSKIRYIYESWPENRNVSTEFLLDCLKTYEKTEQEQFQITNGILDWAIQKAILMQRPIEMNFYDWLCYCHDGVIINNKFKGFADFYIQYEISDFAFEDDSLKDSIKSIIENHCTRSHHEEDQIIIDPKTNEPVVDQDTGQPKTIRKTVFDNKWKPKSSRDSIFTDLFVNKILNSSIQNHVNDSKNILEDNEFTLEMIDYTIVRKRVEDYLINKYNTLFPYISVRQPDEIVTMFSLEVRMKTAMRDSSKLGASPGVSESIIKQRVQQRMIELFGESLECEFDQKKLSQAISDTQFRYDGESDECFIYKTKYYSLNREIYCAPAGKTKIPNLLTGRQCAVCQGDLCFATCIKKEPDWKDFKLIHILEILGYNVLEETEAGYIPNQTYNQFIVQINKAIRFYKRLVCQDCGHILFPVKVNSNNRFKCLLPSCINYNKEVYLSYCHVCKSGLIDSRKTKKCPNNLYICNDCGSCCSNEFFEYMATRYRRLGQQIPNYIARYIGNGHNDKNMFFCPTCGKQKTDYTTPSGTHEWRCFDCNPVDENEESKVAF